MTPLRKRLLEEIERRNYTQATAHAYVSAIRRFAEYFRSSPEKLGIEHVRQYQLHRLEQKVKPHSISVEISALRFLYNKVLRRRYSREDLPLPRVHKYEIPVILSAEEVARLIDAAPNLRYRTILMTLYSTGMRRAELCRMRPEDIDKERKMLRIPHGKGDKPREVPLTARSTADVLPLGPTPQRLDVPQPAGETPRRTHHRQNGLARLPRQRPPRRHQQAHSPAHAAALCRVPDYSG